MSSSADVYRGRFAPSPTGPLHFGSLVGALASYLDARSHGGLWYVRIEDIDPLREKPDAADRIIRALEAHGLHWDGEISYQSTHQERFQAMLDQLIRCGRAYPCPCSRRELAENQGRHREDCRHRQIQYQPPMAWRFAVTEQAEAFQDCIQGAQPFVVKAELDDFVLQRKEGFYAYQLAVVADDHDSQISHVIRGVDLIDSTPLQTQLYRALDWQPPEFGHFPVIVTDDGQKLSKQRLSPALDERQARHNLVVAGEALNLLSEPERQHDKTQLPDQLADLLVLYTRRWDRRPLRGVRQRPSPAAGETVATPG